MKAKKALTYLHPCTGSTPAERFALKPEKGHGGYDETTKTLTPLRKLRDGSGVPGEEIFDTIALAFQEGILVEDAWATQLFETEDDLDYFLELLEDYDSNYRIWDKWYIAFAGLADGNRFNCEEGFTQSQQIADSIREGLEETGQRKMFRKR